MRLPTLLLSVVLGAIPPFSTISGSQTSPLPTVSGAKLFSGLAAACDIEADKPGSPALNSANIAPEGFVALFNGKDLDGWWGVTNWGGKGNDINPRKYVGLGEEALETRRNATAAAVARHWLARDGELVNDGAGPFLATTKNYGDFELIVDYKTVPKADSGVYLRGYPQVQIWDSTNPREFKNGAQKGSGALWNNSREGRFPLNKADLPFGEWNRLRILMVGSRVWVWLNGKPTVLGAVLEDYLDRRTPILPRGPILLQTHGGEIRWRNIFIREIPPETANAILAARAPAGFNPIFDGVSLEGWAGATNAVAIQDGAIAWLPQKGGTLHTTREFSDFSMRFEFKLPPGANNGVVVRYPGKGDGAYAGMCEIQVLDDNYEKVRKEKIDPRQAHGSAYGMVAAARGYQRPYGEWNWQEITVRGTKVRVELNGFVILDADLSTVKQFMHKRPHPGKDRKSGFIGFAGHNDRIQFRNISVREIPAK
ncbi:MAG: DUF1080 domain-containing protein [Puniceicoccales bacterium]|jgi:hypothetical protein|nr:DUF1080 domain-containing protein [Puniceicoccales bacterium]